MPKYAQLEIDQIRRQSKAQVSSEANSSKEGVARETILQFMSDADQRLQSLVLSESPRLTLWSERVEYDVSGNTYALPENLYGADIKKVEYSYTGDERFYRPLKLCALTDLPVSLLVEPSVYTLIGSSLILGSTSSDMKGKIRITYNKTTDLLDVRRGTVVSTPNDGTNYTQIVLANDANLDETSLGSYDFLCVNTPKGVVERYNTYFTSYDTSTKTITLGTGEAIASGTITPGSFITLGQYTTTHSKLPIFVDRYRINYADLMVKALLSNSDSQEKISQLSGLEQDILERFSTMQSVPMTWPVLNTTWL